MWYLFFQYFCCFSNIREGQNRKQQIRTITVKAGFPLWATEITFCIQKEASGAVLSSQNHSFNIHYLGIYSMTEFLIVIKLWKTT